MECIIQERVIIIIWHNHGTIGYANILYLDFPEGSQPTNYIQPWQNITSDTTMFNTLTVK